MSPSFSFVQAAQSPSPSESRNPSPHRSMSFLRRVKTTIYAPSTITSDNDSASTRDTSQVYSSPAVKEARRASNPVDLSQAIESPYIVHLRQQQIHQPPHALQNPLTEIRKRLARKASVFSLRGKAKPNHHREGDTRKTKNRAIARLEKELPEPRSSSLCSSPLIEDKGRSAWDINSSRSTVISSPGDRPAHDSANLDASPSPPKSKQGIELQPQAKAPVNRVTPNFALQSLQDTIRLKQRLLVQEGYIKHSQIKDHTFVRMAAENAAPPVPYARLQELTISVRTHPSDLLFYD